ncbi:MAG TPA: triose-phosphate isomerase [Bdellovibrionota bacterium]|nr:triose-phosphate isomerase [Bdellovibrionota bacterium]
MAIETYLIGNWKLFKTRAEIDAFYTELKAQGLRRSPSVGLAVAVSPSHMDYAKQRAPEGVEIFSQNVAYALEGAYTGEISARQLKDIGVSGTLVGHSERRQYFADTNETVVRRALVALEAGLKVVFCIGETLEEREAGRTEAVLGEQVGALLDASRGSTLLANTIESGAFWVAYEPVWAIGTGKTASPEMAEEAHLAIRRIFEKGGLKSPKILYGGSVKPTNFKELLEQPNIAGGLVGGASLEASSYLTLAASID